VPSCRSSAHRFPFSFFSRFRGCRRVALHSRARTFLFLPLFITVPPQAALPHLPIEPILTPASLFGNYSFFSACPSWALLRARTRSHQLHSHHRWYPSSPCMYFSDNPPLLLSPGLPLGCPLQALWVTIPQCLFSVSSEARASFRVVCSALLKIDYVLSCCDCETPVLLSAPLSLPTFPSPRWSCGFALPVLSPFLNPDFSIKAFGVTHVSRRSFPQPVLVPLPFFLPAIPS